MQQFLIFVRKEFHHIFRDRKSLLIIFALPIAQILIFGFALTNEIKNAKIAVLDLAQDEESQKAIQELDASRYFSVVQYAPSQQAIYDDLLADKIKLGVIFPENFKEDLLHGNDAQIQLLADATDPNTATTIVVYANAILRDYQTTLNDDFTMPMQIKPELHMLYRSAAQRRIHLCSGCDGHDIDVDLGHDDIHRDSARKRIEYHGGDTRLSPATICIDRQQGHTIHCNFIGEREHDLIDQRHPARPADPR